MTRFVLPILVAARMMWPAPAMADEGNAISAREKALAKKAYQHALQLYKAEKYQEAASELRKAYDYAPLPPILFNLGITYIKLGQKAAARAALREYLLSLPQAPNRGEVEELLKSLGPASQDEAPPPLEPARAHTTQPAAAGAAAAKTLKSQAETVADDDAENPLVEVPRSQRAIVAPTPTPADHPDRQGRTPYRWLKWGAAGAAAVAGTVGILMLMQASDQEATLLKAAAPNGGYPSQRYDSDLRAIEDGYRTNKTWGTVALFGAVAAAGASVTFFVLDHRSESRARAHVVPVAGHGFAGVSAGGSF